VTTGALLDAVTAVAVVVVCAAASVLAAVDRAAGVFDTATDVAAEAEAVVFECCTPTRPPSAAVAPTAPNAATRVTRLTSWSPARRPSDVRCSLFITPPFECVSCQETSAMWQGPWTSL
jgi:hypothetical protein